MTQILQMAAIKARIPSVLTDHNRKKVDQRDPKTPERNIWHG